MIRNAIWLAALGLCLVGGTALADDVAPAPAAATPAPAAKKGHHTPYGTAGCGLGSIIISSPGIVQIFAATTNGTSANQTFAITSGTSNCQDPEAGEETAKVFVQANRVALARDISRGQGETINDIAAIEGCADAKAVGATLQRNFKAIFPNGAVSSDQVTDVITTTLKSDASLACTGVGG